MEKYTAVSVRIKNKKWQARFRYKELGKWKNLDRMLPEATGKKEAVRMAEALRAELNKTAEKEAYASEHKTVKEVVLDYLDYQLERGLIEKSTYSRQIDAFHASIEPYLGDYIFDTLDRTAIDNWHSILSKLGRKQSTIYVYYQILSKVYRHYFLTKQIEENPFANIEGIHRKKQVDKTHLTEKQMEKFLNSVFQEYEPEDPMYAAVLLAFYAGLRRGEILGLRWHNVDFKRNTITIDTAIGKGNGGAYTKGPKNSASIRTIPMLPQLAHCLKLRYNAIKPEGNWFVTGYEERFMQPSVYAHTVRNFYDAYGLVDAYGKPLNTKGLRHNFATVGVRSNIDIKALSLILGHADTSMTLNTYADDSEQSKQASMVRMSAVFSEETDDADYYPQEPEEAE